MVQLIGVECCAIFFAKSLIKRESDRKWLENCREQPLLLVVSE